MTQLRKEPPQVPDSRCNHKRSICHGHSFTSINGKIDFKAFFFYSQTCLWLNTIWNMFKSWTINKFKIDKKKNAMVEEQYLRELSSLLIIFNKVKLILYKQIQQCRMSINNLEIGL